MEAAHLLVTGRRRGFKNSASHSLAGIAEVAADLSFLSFVGYNTLATAADKARGACKLLHRAQGQKLGGAILPIDATSQ
jgi:hypothetical protein